MIALIGSWNSGFKFHNITADEIAEITSSRHQHVINTWYGLDKSKPVGNVPNGPAHPPSGPMLGPYVKTTKKIDDVKTKIRLRALGPSTHQPDGQNTSEGNKIKDTIVQLWSAYFCKTSWSCWISICHIVLQKFTAFEYSACVSVYNAAALPADDILETEYWD